MTDEQTVDQVAKSPQDPLPSSLSEALHEIVWLRARLAAAAMQPALDEIERLTEALTLVERLYHLDDKDAGWRAARMNGVAREAQDGGDLGRYHRIFPRADLKGGDQ